MKAYAYNSIAMEERDFMTVAVAHITGNATPQQLLELGVWLQQPACQALYQQLLSIWTRELPAHTAVEKK